MTTPNLFEFATSEASQEAFLCWLLLWASPEYKNGNDKHKVLNETATDLIKFFFKTAKKELLEPISKIEIEKQVGNKKNRLDVFCIVNDTYCLLIEHKVGTIQGKNQLTKYLNYIVNDKPKFTLDNIIPIYLQTHDQSNYKKVFKDGFFPVRRHELISILKKNFEVISNYSDIYTDFFDYLQSIENSVQKYKTEYVSDWSPKAWIGFYQYLQTFIDDSHWKYVHNESKGFMGLWCYIYKLDDVKVYLQFEQDKICFKVNVAENKLRKKYRNSLSKFFIKEAQKFDLKVVKPKSFGFGKTMTFAILETPILDKTNKAAINLKEVEKLMTTLKKFMQYSVYEYSKTLD